jgi:hypothetical protein
MKGPNLARRGRDESDVVGCFVQRERAFNLISANQTCLQSKLDSRAPLSTSSQE